MRKKGQNVDLIFQNKKKLTNLVFPFFIYFTGVNEPLCSHMLEIYKNKNSHMLNLCYTMLQLIIQTV